MIFRSRIDDKEIEINLDENKKYGVMLSGGLDSAILLGLILIENRELKKNTSIQPFSMIKHDHSYKYVSGILDYFRRKFEINIPYTILIGNPDAHHSKQSTIATLEVFSKYPDIDFIFNGVNQNPPPPWGDPAWLFPDRVKKSPHKKITMPFVDLYKSHILDLMVQHDLLDLMKLTHSCTENKVGRCNACFQCNERIWAFEQLSIEDTGSF